MSLGSILLGSLPLQALGIKILADVLHELSVKLDASGIAAKNAKYLKLVSAVLVVLVTAINLSMSGDLANLNMADVINKLIEAAAGVIVGSSRLVSGLSRGFAGNVKAGVRKILK